MQLSTRGTRSCTCQFCNVVICGIQMVVSVTNIVRSAHSCFQIAVMVKHCFTYFQVFVVNLSTTENFTLIWVSPAFHNRCLLLHTYIVAYTIFLLRYSILGFLLVVTEDAFVL